MSKNPMSKNRIATTAEITRLVEIGASKGYNRSIPASSIEQLKLDPAGYHVIQPLFIHEHKQGMPSEPHQRCMVYLAVEGQDTPKQGILDFDIKEFEALLYAHDLLSILNPI